jgi:hypothetical protein
MQYDEVARISSGVLPHRIEPGVVADHFLDVSALVMDVCGVLFTNS